VADREGYPLSWIFGSKKQEKDSTKNSAAIIIKKKLEQNVAEFNNFVGANHNVNIRKIRLPIDKGIDAVLFFVDGLTDKLSINISVIQPLLAHTYQNINQDNLINLLQEKIVQNLQTEKGQKWDDLLDKMFSGDTILLVDGYDNAIIFGTRRWTDRGVQPAVSEPVVYGPKDSFSETLLLNTTLLRRRIKSYKLKMEYMIIGEITKTDIIISYLDGVVNPRLVEEIKQRLKRIKTDSILCAGMIEEFIEDSPFAIMPQIMHTEKPNKAAAHILEGGVAIFVDGSPTTLLLPVVFWQFLHSPDDYSERVYTTHTLRLLRLIAFIASLALSPFYVAVSSFHPELIPFGLLQVIVSGRQGVPFPILIEVLIMEFVLEITREAAIRLPRYIGNTIGIVGALVLGQAAIQSKLASSVTITIVALAAVSNFTIPSFNAALAARSLRFLLIIASGVFGIMGFISSVFVLLIYLSSLHSFGVPYLAPLSPVILSDLKDTIVRMPIWMMSKRPKFLNTLDDVKQDKNLKPSATKDKR